ncbi:hypothetical protein Tco_1486346 [Tanacetum coccineum]
MLFYHDRIGQPVVIIDFSHDPCLYQFLYLYLDDSGTFRGLAPFLLSERRISFLDIEPILFEDLLGRCGHSGPRKQSGTFSDSLFHHNIESFPTRIVTIPPSTRNLSIPWAVDGTAWISLIPSLPMIPLYGDNDLTIMKLIHAFVECSVSPIITKSLSCPSGHIVYPLKLVNDVVAGTIWLLISGRSRLKQCS